MTSSWFFILNFVFYDADSIKNCTESKGTD